MGHIGRVNGSHRCMLKNLGVRGRVGVGGGDVFVKDDCIGVQLLETYCFILLLIFGREMLYEVLSVRL